MRFCRLCFCFLVAACPLTLSAQLGAGSRLVAVSQGAEGLPSGIQVQASAYGSIGGIVFGSIVLEAGFGYHALGPAFPMGGLVSWRAAEGAELYAGIGYVLKLSEALVLFVSLEPFARILNYSGSGVIFGELGIRLSPELVLSGFKGAPWLALSIGIPLEYAQGAYSSKIGAGFSASASVDFFKIKRSGL
jgi:hypothetical protein